MFSQNFIYSQHAQFAANDLNAKEGSAVHNSDDTCYSSNNDDNETNYSQDSLAEFDELANPFVQSDEYFEGLPETGMERFLDKS